MKKFRTPEIEIEKFEIDDVITTSTCVVDGIDNSGCTEETNDGPI